MAKRKEVQEDTVPEVKAVVIDDQTFVIPEEPVNRDEIINTILSLDTIDTLKKSLVVDYLNLGMFENALATMLEIQTIQTRKKMSIIEEINVLI